MTEEIVKSIKEAEMQAAQIKAAAQLKAQEILSEAEMQAARSEKSSAEVCKAYRESQIKLAQADAEAAYAATLKEKEREAKEYCTRVAEQSDISVSKIVGRVVSGDC